MKRIVTLLAAALTASVAISPARAAEPFAIGWASADAVFMPFFYAQEKGLFAKHGLDSKLVFMDSGTKAVQGLIGGGIDVATGSADPDVSARISGADIRIVALTLGVLTGKVVVAKDIKTSQDLKGKKWAISSFGSEAHLAERLFLKKYGLAESDVTVLQVGNQSNRLAALEAGQVSASTFLPPVVNKVEAAGYPVLAQLPDLAPDYASTVAAVTTSTLQKRRPAVKNFIAAVTESIVALKKDRDGGVEVVRKYLNTSEADAVSAWSYYAPLFPANVRPTATSVQFLLDESKDPKAKTMKPADFIDTGPVDELQK